MTEHLGYEKNSNSGDNSRNRHTEKTVLLENQSATISVPRDRAGTFEPIIVPKHEKRVPLFNDQIISMYGRGMTDREIRGHLEEIYEGESLNYQLRKVTRNYSTFCTDDVIFKIMYLAIRNASKKWTMPVKEWGQALNQFAIGFGKERVPF